MNHLSPATLALSRQLGQAKADHVTAGIELADAQKAHHAAQAAAYRSGTQAPVESAAVAAAQAKVDAIAHAITDLSREVEVATLADATAFRSSIAAKLAALSERGRAEVAEGMAMLRAGSRILMAWGAESSAVHGMPFGLGHGITSDDRGPGFRALEQLAHESGGQGFRINIREVVDALHPVTILRAGAQTEGDALAEKILKGVAP